MDKNATMYDWTGDEVLSGINGNLVDLPPPDTKRWVARRKAVIVDAVRSGAISLEEACRSVRGRHDTERLLPAVLGSASGSAKAQLNGAFRSTDE